MKRFSLFLMIVLLVSAVFISCSAEPANDSGATVAVSISSSKALSATPHVENLPDESTLYWYYTARKDGSGFTTGQTSGLTPIQTDTDGNPVVGLPTVIGYAGASGTGTWFSSGNWTFKFYAFETKVSTAASIDTVVGTAVYTDNTESGVVVPVTPVENSDIGGEASITLKLNKDPRSDSEVYIGKYGYESETPTTQNSIYVDFDNAYSGTASDYKLKIYVDGVQVLTSETITGTYDSNSNTGRVMFKTVSDLATYDDDNSLHLIEFKVFKGEEADPYASGSTGIWARKGYTWYIAGDLVSLESVAQVEISVTNANAFPASQEPTTIEISSEKELRAFAAFVNSGNNCEGITIELKNDITLTQPWTPIGNGYRGEENPKVFKGTFNGNSYTITGLTSAGYSVNPVSVTDSTEYTYGLFGYVNGGTIKYVKIASVAISGGSLLENAGAVVGYLDGGTVDNCQVLSGSISGFNGIGGVVGRAYGTVTINKCSNAASITGSKNVAGIVGFANPTSSDNTVTITNNTNSGAVTRDTTNGDAGAAGGVAGIVCYGTGSEADPTGYVTITGNTNSGSLSGAQQASIAKATSHNNTAHVNVQAN